MEPPSHARLVAMRLLNASNTPERQQTAAKSSHLCLSPTDPSEDPLAMASPVLTGKAVPVTSPDPAKKPLPGLQFAISAQRAPNRELRLPSFSCPSYELENASFATSSADEEDTEQVQEKATVSQRRKKGSRRGTLHPEAKNVLKAWMFSPEHFAHPYPSEEEKEELANEAGIEVKQLSNWFTNARKRLWQPVLRQSGVEVKNFLSTGRGGPRGNKLDVPLNLHQMVSQSPAPSPPNSPKKRSWSVMQEKSTPSSTTAEPFDASKNSSAFKRVKTRNSLSTDVSAPQLHDLELLAATSLLRLQHVTQSVH
ncbi:homebox domain-containing protein [Plasmopara halstedii]|uniref:Homebox domain-containing protein n=1 Tax=Plasmopara halstedii TaxID=4781 RepID=A0A0P1B4M7_PLAHL|nr:homebox domain-containing protein [Plasmopara halstedii]CEG48589.1 homebox domain-containing protein [Plasmopara halstedii]|eukprot:XP_024584958.1 homebox domain-containing protein [Plasmopara halstedii]